MVSSARQAIACILVIFGAAICIQSQTFPAKGPTATITGKVTVKGKGLPGVAVGLRLLESSGQQQSTRYKAVTDEEGNYRISNVPPGNYQVVTVAPAFASPEEPGRGKTLIISKDETIENIDFALLKGGVITGRVTDSDGRPVVEQEVSILPVQMDSRFHYGPSSNRTDDRGIYRIFGVPAGNYRVAAGQMESESIGRMGRGSYRQTFHPAAADISQAGIIEVTEGSETSNIDITLGRTLVKYSARGRVVDGETSQPVANVGYGVQMFVNESRTSSTTFGAVSNSEGEFRLDSLSPGKYAVFIEPRPDSEWRAEAVRFEVIDQDVTGLVIKTSKAASVAGVVVFDGLDDKAGQAIFKGTRMYAHVTYANSINGPSHSQSSPINPDGSFRVAGLQAGLLAFSVLTRARLQVARVERDGVVYPKGIEIKEGEHISGVRVVVTLGNGTIRGVVKVETGTLPQNASVSVSARRLTDNPESMVWNSGGSAQVDARGQFLIEGLIPGTYEVNGYIYIPGSRGPMQPNAKQQVVITGEGVTSITLTVNLNSTSDRP